MASHKSLPFSCSVQDGTHLNHPEVIGDLFLPRMLRLLIVFLNRFKWAGDNQSRCGAYEIKRNKMATDLTKPGSCGQGEVMRQQPGQGQGNHPELFSRTLIFAWL